MDWISSATSASSCSRLGGLVADLSVAIVSLAASIGPPGSASEIAMPAMNGARTIRVHSSSVKSSFVVHVMCLPLGRGGRVYDDRPSDTVGVLPSAPRMVTPRHVSPNVGSETHVTPPSQDGRGLR